MKVVIAPDKLKGSLSGKELVQIISEALRSRYSTIDLQSVLLSDGGDGLLDALEPYGQYERIEVEVYDPLWRTIKASYLFDKKQRLALIEMSTASGLHLLAPEEYDCLRTTTYGTGQLISHALKNGASDLVIGIGGSATCDAGIGMATALGYRFYDGDGRFIRPNGKAMRKITTIDLTDVDPKIFAARIRVACDVDNPLLGTQGAAYVYAPQKGADAATVIELDKGLKNMARIMRRNLDIDVQNMTGAGAAGGMGAGCVAFLGADLQSGVNIVLQQSDYHKIVADTDYIIFAEGKVDHQSFMGKVLGALVDHKPPNTQLIVICGRCDLSPAAWQSRSIDQLYSIMDLAPSEESAFAEATYWIQQICERIDLRV